MKRRVGMGVVLVAAAMVCPPAWAARTRFHDLAESPIYKEKAGGMIGRGLLNVVTSFVDVLVNTVNETKAGPPFVGTVVGLARGTACSVLRLGSGAIDVGTFWVPGFNGFPVSDSYESCLSGIDTSASMTAPAVSAGSSMWEAEPEPVRTAVPVTSEPAEKTWKK